METKELIKKIRFAFAPIEQEQKTKLRDNLRKELKIEDSVFKNKLKFFAKPALISFIFILISIVIFNSFFQTHEIRNEDKKKILETAIKTTFQFDDQSFDTYFNSKISSDDFINKLGKAEEGKKIYYTKDEFKFYKPELGSNYTKEFYTSGRYVKSIRINTNNTNYDYYIKKKEGLFGLNNIDPKNGGKNEASIYNFKKDFGNEEYIDSDSGYFSDLYLLKKIFNISQNTESFGEFKYCRNEKPEIPCTMDKITTYDLQELSANQDLTSVNFIFKISSKNTESVMPFLDNPGDYQLLKYRILGGKIAEYSTENYDKDGKLLYEMIQKDFKIMDFDSNIFDYKKDYPDGSYILKNTSTLE